MQTAHWLMSLCIEPKSLTDQQDLIYALTSMVSEHREFAFWIDQESGQTILGGMNELHLDIMIEILRRNHGVNVEVGAPQVAYRERIAGWTEIDQSLRLNRIGPSSFAQVRLRLEPNVGLGNEFINEITHKTALAEYFAGVVQGVDAVWQAGALVGFPLIDTRVTLVDAVADDVESSVNAFKRVTETAMIEGCKKIGVRLLEPIMDLEVQVAAELAGAIIDDITSRRGLIRSKTLRGGATIVCADVPLAQMFGYHSSLRSISGGSAAPTMRFSHYGEVPRNITSGDPENFPPAIGMRA
jgi:elongation factor G